MCAGAQGVGVDRERGGGDGNSERTSNAVGVAMAPTNRLSVSQIFHTRKETESVSHFDVKSSKRPNRATR